MNDEFDDLDRALFALPLEEPPEGLRAAILGATIYARPAAIAPFSTLETIGMGLALALAAWVALICLVDQRFVGSLAAVVADVTRVLSNAEVLLWFAVGMLASAWLWVAVSSPWQPLRRKPSST